MKNNNGITIFFLVLILVLILASMLPGCASKPKDFKLCVEMSLDRGECMRVLSGQKVRIDKDHANPDTGQDWWTMRPTNLILPLESWLDIKKFIINLCKQNQDKNMCDKQVSSWERSLRQIDQDLKNKGISVPQDPEPVEPPKNPQDDIYFGLN